MKTCEDCLRPPATKAQWSNDHGNGNGCECTECASVCWGDALWCRDVAAKRKKERTMTPASYWKQMREACDKATPGPWSQILDGNDRWFIEADSDEEVARRLNEADADFIAIAREAVPLALARIEELEAELTRIKDETRDLAANWTRGSIDGCDRSVFVGDARNAILDIINGPSAALVKP